MGHYKSNLRDLEFNLFEVLGRQDVLGTGPYEDVDADTAREMLHEVARLAENELADSLQDSDRNPPVFDPADGSVTLPESFKKSYAAYMDGGWGLLDIPGELGGHGRSRRRCAGRSPSWSSAPTPPCTCTPPAMAFAKVLYYARHRRTRRSWPRTSSTSSWGATMVLTEPDAGSDVGAGRTRAVQQPDGTWHITGVKRFITSGRARPQSTTSSTSCWPGPRAPAPAPRGCRCSSSPSSTSTSRPASSASATAPTSPTSSTRWA